MNGAVPPLLLQAFLAWTRTDILYMYVIYTHTHTHTHTQMQGIQDPYLLCPISLVTSCWLTYALTVADSASTYMRARYNGRK